ncbi:3'(2'),5'-bisphosphate nucleotidase [Coemansia interrupta]|uniref:3'(2'),5'-bisphosphate nucleotidase n=1 Tax=Coemansia interrupta TaxID=1126814 RepID=A0A9W8HB73_9FUNG|nr:3'(2'),5'-bisphosphate nucleotidase [Coemansia interrupta]
MARYAGRKLASEQVNQSTRRISIPLAYLANERQVAIQAVEQASKLCQAVFNRLVTSETLTKKDKSPVTIADFGAQAVVNAILAEHFPADPIVGEEDSKDLQGDAGKEMRNKVVDLVNSVGDRPMSEAEVLQAIDRGQYAGGATGRHWTLDPIDGTKGFLRGEQYAVCLALIVDGQVRLGVLGCPNLEQKQGSESKGVLMVAVDGQGAFQRALDGGAETPIRASSVSDTTQAAFCESVESGHTSHGDSERISALLGITKAPVRMDSQCKYAAVARGNADVYLRLPTRADYEEKIWDHAAGNVIVREAGGRVGDITGKPLDFSHGRTLAQNRGVVATSAGIFDQVVGAVQNVLGSKAV